QRVAVRMGYKNAADHRAMALTTAAVSRADLILGMDLNHRRIAAQLQPTAVRRAFTLLEFAHIVGHIEDTQLAEMHNGNDAPAASAVQIVMRMRGVVPRLGTERLYEVEDPYGRSTQVYERSFKQVQQAVTDIGEYFSRAARLLQRLATFTMDQADMRHPEHVRTHTPQPSNRNPPTPALILDVPKLEGFVARLQKAVDTHWSNAILSYSFKTNSLPWLIGFMRDRGLWAEVVSDTEYQLAIALGYSPEHIIYNGPIKSRQQLWSA